MPFSISYSFLIESALKGTVILGAACLVALFLRGKSAALRHLMWTVAFAALLLLPLLSAALPAFHLPVTGSLLAPVFTFQTTAQSLIDAPARYASQNNSTVFSLRLLTSLPASRMLLLLLWAAGCAVSLTQMLLGLIAIARLRRKSRALTLPGFTSMAELLSLRQPVDLLETPAVTMPVTFGLLRHAIFLPADAKDWTQERLRVVLLHELAHVLRHDAATQLLARCTLSLYWWNPFAWIAWQAFLKERERAADDLVLRSGECASHYARHLLEIARSMQLSSSLTSASVAMTRGSHLESRLSSILNSNCNRDVPRRASAMAASLAAIAIIVPVAALKATGVHPQNNATQTAPSSPASALIKQGDETRALRKYADAQALYKKALDISSVGAETATALIRLGTSEIETKNFDDAIIAFERAKTADPTRANEATMWIAIAQQNQNNLDAAGALYASAIAAEDPDSASAATIRELYARLLEKQGRSDEAAAMTKQAVLIRNAQTAQASAAIHPSSPDIYKIGADVKAPTLLSKVEPSYTDDARIAKYAGTVLLSIEISKEGSPENINVLRGLGFGLEQKAMEAVRQWKFQPATKNGDPVAVSARVEVNFRLL